MRKYYDIEKFLDDCVLTLMVNDQATVILDAELAKEVFDRITDEYMEANVEICDDFNDEYAYGIDKFETTDGKVFISVYSIFDEDDEMISIDNDYVLLQDDLLEIEELNSIEFSEELVICDISECDYYFTEYDDSFDIENEDLEETCDCNTCQHRFVCDESDYPYEDVVDDEEEIEFFSDLAELIQDTMEKLEDFCCDECQRDLLTDFAFNILSLASKYDDSEED